MKLYLILLVAHVFLTTNFTFAQVKNDEHLIKYPNVGEQCPYFILKDIKYSYKKEASLTDFNGKWLILDFWTQGCLSCVESFPKLNKLQEQFKEKIQLMLIGRDYLSKAGIEKVSLTFEKFRSKLDLKIPIVYDTLLFSQFGVSSVPYIVWITPKGTIAAITTSTDLNSGNIQKFLDGEVPLVKTMPNVQEEKHRRGLYDYKKPLLVNGNGGSDSDLLFRSLLAKWDPVIPPNVPGNLYNTFTALKKYEAIGIDVISLYRLAYFGIAGNPQPEDPLYKKYSMEAEIRLSKSDEIMPDATTGKNYYSYSLKVPNSKISPQSLKKILQRELLNNFGYDVKIACKMLPYWKLVAKKETKKQVETKGGAKIIEATASDFILRNGDVNDLVRQIWRFNQLGPPVIDKTGIKSKIDFEMHCIMFDFNALRKALQEKGMDILPAKKKMAVLIIKDPK